MKMLPDWEKVVPFLYSLEWIGVSDTKFTVLRGAGFNYLQLVRTVTTQYEPMWAIVEHLRQINEILIHGKRALIPTQGDEVTCTGGRVFWEEKKPGSALVYKVAFLDDGTDLTRHRYRGQRLALSLDVQHLPHRDFNYVEGIFVSDIGLWVGEKDKPENV